MFKLSFKRDLKNRVLVDIRIRVFKSPLLAMCFPRGSEVKSPPAMQKTGSIPRSGRSPGKGTGNPLQYSCLENPMDRGARWVTVRGVTKSWTQLSDSHTHTHTHTWGSNPCIIME